MLQKENLTYKRKPPNARNRLPDTRETRLGLLKYTKMCGVMSNAKFGATARIARESALDEEIQSVCREL